MLRIVTVVVIACVLLAIGGSLACLPGAGDDGCCRDEDSCAFCLQSGIAMEPCEPMTFALDLTSIPSAEFLPPSSPDLARLLRPPAFLS